MFGDAFRSMLSTATDEVKSAIGALVHGAEGAEERAVEWVEAEPLHAAAWAKKEGEEAVQLSAKTAQNAGGALDALKDKFLKAIKGVCIPCIVKSIFGSGPSVKGATEEQKAQSLKAHGRAIEMIDNALARLEDAKKSPDPEVKEFFDIDGTEAEDQKKLDRLIANFQHIKNGMSAADYVKEDSPVDADGNVTAAYVKVLTSQLKDHGGADERTKYIYGTGPVHICEPGFFDQPTDDDRASTIVHEMSHYRVGTDDHAYVWQSGFASLTQDQKMDNADSYGRFAEAVSQP